MFSLLSNNLRVSFCIKNTPLINGIKAGLEIVKLANKKPSLDFECISAHKELGQISIQPDNKTVLLAKKLLETPNICVGFHGTLDIDSILLQASLCPNNFITSKKCDRGEEGAGLYMMGCPEVAVHYTGAKNVVLVATEDSHIGVDREQGTMFVLSGKKIVVLGVFAVKNLDTLRDFKRPSMLSNVSTVMTEILKALAN